MTYGFGVCAALSGRSLMTNPKPKTRISVSRYQLAPNVHKVGPSFLEKCVQENNVTALVKRRKY